MGASILTSNKDTPFMQIANEPTRDSGRTPALDRAPRPLLLVDDDELELTLLADRLSAAGFRVVTAHNGEQANRLLEQQSFPVVITDYQMPVMNGLELADSIRSRASSAEASDSYVIVWSIRSADEDRERSFSHGVDDHVSKQLSDAELLARIEAGFQTLAVRKSLRRSRRVRDTTVVAERSVDADTWNSAASRLHAEILRAHRTAKPLTVLTLHVEHTLAHSPVVADERDRTPGFSAVQLDCSQLAFLVGTVSAAVRQSIDWVMPLDVGEGLARLLVVLPETGAQNVAAIRQRLHAAIAGLAVTDEFAELMPECAVGVATFDPAVQSEAVESGANAAALVAAAEQRVEKLLQAAPLH